jgi:hypothetical protein
MWIYSTTYYPISLTFILILSSHLRLGLPSDLFLQAVRLHLMELILLRWRVINSHLRTTSKLLGHPLSAVQDCLFYFKSGGCLLHPFTALQNLNVVLWFIQSFGVKDTVKHCSTTPLRHWSFETTQKMHEIPHLTSKTTNFNLSKLHLQDELHETESLLRM